MDEKKDKTTLMILLTALGALAIIILFGWVAFFNPMEKVEEKPQLTLSSFSTDNESPLLPEKSAEELLLDGLQKGDEPPLLMDENKDIVITIDNPEANKTTDIPMEKKPVIKPVQEKKAVVYREVTEEVYWLQVGSFPNSVKADDLRSYLKENGIETVLQTKEINGILYYRVRVGAFMNRNEADSFKEKLLGLNNIEEVISYTGTLTKKVPVN